MPNLTGVLETALYVSDVRRSIQFYRSILGLEPMIADDRFCAFAVAGRQVLLLFKRGTSLQPIPLSGGTIPPHDGSGRQHFAFSIETSEVETWEHWLPEKGVGIESKVYWERGGVSLYFRDPDQHLVELITPGCWPIF